MDPVGNGRIQTTPKARQWVRSKSPLKIEAGIAVQPDSPA